jgi:hypothetical protein
VCGHLLFLAARLPPYKARSPSLLPFGNFRYRLREGGLLVPCTLAKIGQAVKASTAQIHSGRLGKRAKIYGQAFALNATTFAVSAAGAIFQ